MTEPIPEQCCGTCDWWDPHPDSDERCGVYVDLDKLPWWVFVAIDIVGFDDGVGCRLWKPREK